MIRPAACRGASRREYTSVRAWMHRKTTSNLNRRTLPCVRHQRDAAVGEAYGPVLLLAQHLDGGTLPHLGYLVPPPGSSDYAMKSRQDCGRSLEAELCSSARSLSGPTVLLLAIARGTHFTSCATGNAHSIASMGIGPRLLATSGVISSDFALDSMRTKCTRRAHIASGSRSRLPSSYFIYFALAVLLASKYIALRYAYSRSDPSALESPPTQPIISRGFCRPSPRFENSRDYPPFAVFHQRKGQEQARAPALRMHAGWRVFAAPFFLEYKRHYTIYTIIQGHGIATQRQPITTNACSRAQVGAGREGSSASLVTLLSDFVACTICYIVSARSHYNLFRSGRISLGCET